MTTPPPADRTFAARRAATQAELLMRMAASSLKLAERALDGGDFTKGDHPMHLSDYDIARVMEMAVKLLYQARLLLLPHGLLGDEMLAWGDVDGCPLWAPPPDA